MTLRRVCLSVDTTPPLTQPCIFRYCPVSANVLVKSFTVSLSSSDAFSWGLIPTSHDRHMLLYIVSCRFANWLVKMQYWVSSHSGCIKVIKFRHSAAPVSRLVKNSWQIHSSNCSNRQGHHWTCIDLLWWQLLVAWETLKNCWYRRSPGRSDADAVDMIDKYDSVTRPHNTRRWTTMSWAAPQLQTLSHLLLYLFFVRH